MVGEGMFNGFNGLLNWAVAIVTLFIGSLTLNGVMGYKLYKRNKEIKRATIAVEEAIKTSKELEELTSDFIFETRKEMEEIRQIALEKKISNRNK